MTTVEKVLHAAKSLQVFDLEKLIVTCWEMYPESFSMRTYQYPDTNKVKTILYGSRGLLKKGIILKISENKYRINKEVNLTEKETNKQQDPFKKYKETIAYQKYRTGNKANILLSEAILLWGSVKRMDDWDNQFDIENIEQREFIHLHNYLKEKFEKQIKLFNHNYEQDRYEYYS